MDDFAMLRLKMVDSQLKTEGVMDPLVLAAASHRCGGAEIGGGFELSRLHQRTEHCSGDVLNIGLAAIQRRYLFRIDVDSRHGETSGGELDGQGQAHVTQSDNSHVRGFRLDLLLKIIEVTHLIWLPFQKNSPVPISSAGPAKKIA